MNLNDITLDIILDYTKSAEWEDVQDMNWTTAEMQELMIKAIQQVKNIAYEPVLPTVHLDCRECKHYDVDVINKKGVTARMCKVKKNDPRVIVNLKPTDCKDYEYGW